MAKDKKPAKKPVPQDAVVKGPNKKVPIKNLPQDCAP